MTEAAAPVSVVKITSSRDVSIDALKGFLIVLVVLGHASLDDFFRNAERTAAAGLAHALVQKLDIYYYHMPLFLAVGTLFLGPLMTSDIRKAAGTILVPYAIWFFIKATVNEPLAFFSDLPGRLLALGMGNFHYLVSTLWFFPALFSMRILYGLIAAALDTSRRSRILISMILLAAWAAYFAVTPLVAVWHVRGVIPFGVDIALYLLPFCVVMRLVHRKGLGVPCYLAISAILLLTGHFLITWFEPIKTISDYPARIDLAQYSLPYTPPGLAGMFAMSAGVMLAFINFPASNVFFRALAFLGRYTLAIYMLHLFLMWIVNGLGQRALAKLNLDASGAAMFALFVIAVAAAIGIPVIVSRLLMRVSPRFYHAGFTA